MSGSLTSPIEFTTKRYRCPHCAKTYSVKRRTQEHMARCWRNPAVKCCLTCKHFTPATREWLDECAVGVGLAAKCRACEGDDDAMWTERVGVEQTPGWVELPPCRACSGTRLDPNGGTRPITGCGLWTAASE